MPEFTKADAQNLLAHATAPWILDLGIEVLSVAVDEVVARMPFSDKLCREGGTICGQALMALADTTMIISVAAASGGYRPMTTVDTTTHFMKPVSNDAVICTIAMMRMGRTMAFGHAIMTAESDKKPVASATVAYAILGPVAAG